MRPPGSGVSDQTLAVAIPAIASVVVAAIGAIVTLSGRGRDEAVTTALVEQKMRMEALQRRLDKEDDEPAILKQPADGPPA